MKSVYYTFTTWSDGQQAAGFDGSLNGGRKAVMVRQPNQNARTLGGDNVIDLAAWQAANRELWDEPGEYTPEAAAPAPPARRARRSRRRAYVDPELFAILGVVGVLAALMVRVLMF